MNCPKCDEPVDRGCKYCPHCGLPLADDAPIRSDATVIGAPAVQWETSEPESRPWGLYAGGAAACALAAVGIALALTSGGPAKPVVDRPGGGRAQVSLYGSPAVRGGSNLPSSAWVTSPPRGVDTAAQPPAADPAVAQAPTLQAQRPSGRTSSPEVLAPPVLLYRENTTNQRPPLRPGGPQAAGGSGAALPAYGAPAPGGIMYTGPAVNPPDPGDGFNPPVQPGTEAAEGDVRVGAPARTGPQPAPKTGTAPAALFQPPVRSSQPGTPAPGRPAPNPPGAGSGPRR